MDRNIFIIMVLSSLAILPFDLTFKNGVYTARLLGHRSKKWFCFTLWYTLAIMFTARAAYKLIMACMDLERVPLHHLEILIVMPLAAVSMLACAWFCFYDQPELNCELLNTVLMEVQYRKSTATSFQLVKTLESETGGGKLGIQVAIFATLPLHLLMILSFIPSLYIYDSTAPVFLYSAIGSDYRTPGVFAACLVIDTMYGALLSFVQYYIVFLTLGSIGTINFSIFDVHQSTKSPVSQSSSTKSHKSQEFTMSTKFITKSTLELCKTLRKIQLHIQYFNLGLSKVVAVVKTNTQALSVICLFTAAKLFYSNRLMVFLNIMIFSQLTNTFIGTYDPAFSIPGEIQNLKASIERESNNFVFRITRKKYQAVLRSLPPRGIKVGGFRELERATTLNFLQFVVTQVVGLLVSFPN